MSSLNTSNASNIYNDRNSAPLNRNGNKLINMRLSFIHQLQLCSMGYMDGLVGVGIL